MRHPRLVLAAAIIVSLVVTATILELGLRLIAPTGVTGVGWATSDNGRRYGWGFDGGEMQTVRDSDTGRMYVNRANAHGWRDLPRTYDKPAGVFRILVLGDSNIFGYLVPAHQTATRLLEDKLKASGVKAEVINMSLSGWGTDQQVEALRQEGMRYRPDVVVVHFCTNDLIDNFHWTFSGKFSRRRPFYFVVGADGEAIRRNNPNYAVPLGSRLQEYALRHVELAKYAYNGWKTFLAIRKPRYELSAGQVQLMGYDFAAEALPGFTDELGRLVGRQDLSETMLSEVIVRHGLERHRETIIRLAERVNSQEGNVESVYRGHPRYDPELWELFAALIGIAKREAEAGGAKLLISTDLDEGRWQWDVFWHHVDPSELMRQRYLEPNDKVRKIASTQGIGFIEPLHPITRARNDTHPTAQGNEAIADNILAHLNLAGLLPK